MFKYLMQTLWSQDPSPLHSLNISRIMEIVDSFDSVRFNGLYKPLIESWEWTFFINAHSLVEWEKCTEEIMKNIPQVKGRENRIFAELFESEDVFLEPKYLEIELILCDNLYSGLNDYYRKISDVYNEFDDAWFFGGYVPANEPYTVASFYGYESLELVEMIDDKSFTKIGRLENMKSIVERLYRKQIVSSE